uniref:Uncharacterized protein n=1 Tax=Oryza rufipogon TaxID=4529 RepID=A0A0E0PXE3_ORYRU
MGGGPARERRNRPDPCRRPDLAVEQPAAGLSGAATVSGGGGSGVKALAAAEETARSAPGSGGTAADGGVWWRGWRGRRGDGVGEVNLAAPAADPAPGGLAVATVVAMSSQRRRCGLPRRAACTEYYILRLRPYIAPYWILPSTYARTIIMFSSAMPANRKSHKQFNEYEDLVLNVPIEVSLPNE